MDIKSRLAAIPKVISKVSTLATSRSLRVKMALTVGSIAIVIVLIFTMGAGKWQGRTFEGLLLDKAIPLSRLGASAAETVFEGALERGEITRRELLDPEYLPISGTSPAKYKTAYDQLTDQSLFELQNQFLDDSEVVYAFIMDKNGYVPTHNQPFADNAKQKLDDPVSLAAAASQEDYLRQEYKAEGGGRLWDVSTPIYIDGEHWGTFRLGLSLKETEALAGSSKIKTMAILGVVSVLLTAAGLVLITILLYPITQVADTMKEIAQGEGDLTKRIGVSSKDEFGELSRWFDIFVDNLHSIVRNVKASADEVSTTSHSLSGNAEESARATHQIAETVQAMAAGAHDQSSSAAVSAHAVEQLSQAIKQVAESAERQMEDVQVAARIVEQNIAALNQVMEQLEKGRAAATFNAAAATKGFQAAENMMSSMDRISSTTSEVAQRIMELEGHSQEIGRILEVIDGIAGKTNLLALNAAIEAARAGEHGRGFAVVADEVKKLAERSSTETKAIAKLVVSIKEATEKAVAAIDSGKREVEKGIAVTGEAREALGNIQKGSEGAEKLINGIAVAANTLRDESMKVESSIEELVAIATENAASAEEMTSRAGEVKAAIDNVAAVSEESAAATEEISASIEEMSASIEEVAASAETLASMAQQLQEMVGRFKV